MSDVVQQIPRPAGEVKPYKTPDEHWREVVEDIYGPDHIEASFFVRDEDWNTRIWSMQAARDQYEMVRFGFWSAIGILMFVAQLCWWVGFGIGLNRF